MTPAAVASCQIPDNSSNDRLPGAAAQRRRTVVWAAGSSLSRVLEVGVIGLEAELEERRGCQKEISARISGPFLFYPFSVPVLVSTGLLPLWRLVELRGYLSVLRCSAT